MNNILITIKKELRGIVRDKKSLLMMALTPIFIPTFVILMSYIYEEMTTSQQENIYKVGLNYELTEREREILNKDIEPIYYDEEAQMRDAYEKKEISAYIIKEESNYNIYANSQSEDGSIASMHLISYLDTYNTYLGQEYLLDNNIDLNRVYANITYQTNEIKGESIFGNQIILMAVTFTIMAVTLTAIYTSTDTTAGEKERGTLETMLTFPIKRKELILGKYFAIVISGVITMTIGIVLSIFSLWYVWNNFSIYDGTTFNMEILTIVLIIVVLLFYTLFISGLCISIASFSKTFKEAQTALTPISLVTCIPMFLEMLSINIGGVLSFIPIINHTIVINEMLLGNINISSIIITIISSCAYIVLLIMYIVREYNREKILFG